MEKIAILASGSGSNAINIIEYFNDSKDIEVSGVYSNRLNAPVLEKCLDRDIDSYYFADNDELLELLDGENISLVVLAGYLKLIPSELLQLYKTVNIHPALLPKYGGKGMYGSNVHKAVKENNEKVSGVTIHLVNEEYDKGEHLFQAETSLDVKDSEEDIARKVKELEHKHYPVIIEKLLKNEF